jgi:hypothetical protein
MAVYQLIDDGSVLRFAQHRLTPLQCARIDERTADADSPTRHVRVQDDALTITLCNQRD